MRSMSFGLPAVVWYLKLLCKLTIKKDFGYWVLERQEVDAGATNNVFV